ncbi:MAG: CPBP family intramembrane glutamic endopeptidase [Rhizomicrobium sp.]
MKLPALLLYVFLVFALSWALQIGAIAFAGNPESPAAAPWLVSAMFVPALVTLGFVRFYRPTRGLLLWKPTWAMIPLLLAAFVVPTVIGFATVGAIELLQWGHSNWFVFRQTSVSISGGPWLFGRGVQSWQLFVANVCATGGAYALFNALFAIGEELGWRGFLQGQLTARLGTTGGIALLGLLWAFWHLPVLLAGYDYPEQPLLGAFVFMPIQLVAASFFLGWLTVRARTVWPAAVAHGAVNSIEEGVTSHLHLAVPHLAEDLTRLAIIVFVGLMFWALLARRERQNRDSTSHAIPKSDAS